MLSSKRKHAIQGHDIPKSRLTRAGWVWVAVYLGLPVMVLGSLLDFLFQWAWGWCIGVWCIF